MRSATKVDKQHSPFLTRAGKTPHEGNPIISQQTEIEKEDGTPNMQPITDFHKSVKKRLIDMDKTQEWLIDQVKSKTGLFFDSSYLNKVLSGKRNPPVIKTAIREILGMAEQEA